MARALSAGRKGAAVFFRLLLLAAVLAAPLIPAAARAASNPRYAAIVMDADTGMILHQSNADKARHPASLVKMMTLLMTFEALENGRLRLSDRVPVSRHAAGMAPSRIGLPAGSTIRVEDAIYALVTKSANDIAAALGEKIGGTEAGFAAMMTRKAHEIGMSKTVFRNASGLHSPAQVTSARDMAKLARYILASYPQYYHYFSARQFTFQGTTYANHNRLMSRYKGMDGFKTGFIQPSGFNLVASAVRNNRRLIGVVFGGQTAASRDAHMRKLLDDAFAKTASVAVAETRPVPAVPGRKPDPAARAAALASAAPSAGAGAADAIKFDTPRWTSVNPVLQSKAFAALTGQGDFDPADGKRLETGMMAIAAVKGDRAVPVSDVAGQAENAAPRTDGGRSWSVQIGAFSSRVKTDKALKKAADALPGDLAGANAVIVPLKTAEGWIFRGRLAGFSEQEAARACRYLKDCIPVSPSSY